jgi:hypothetical protein
MAWARPKACRDLLLLMMTGAALPLIAFAGEPAPSPPAYQDRYIANGTLQPDISYGDTGYSDSGGLAHSLRVDALVTAISHHTGDAGTNLDENGVIVESQWDTASYGALSLNGAALTTGGDSQAGNRIALALHQRDLPVGGGWRVNNGLGTINTANIDLLRSQQRFYLPTAPILGVSSEWFGPGSAQILGSVGEPGLFQGVRVPGFETLGGSIATLGGQWSPSDPWDLGAQVVGAHDVTALNGFTSSADTQQSSTTGLLTAAWHNPIARAQLNLIDGSVSGTSGGTGGWLDGSLSSGRMLHGAGMFRVDPNLSWGNQPIVSDAQGGYYRNSYQSRRWQTDLGVDYLNSISGRGTSSTYYSGNARYQVSRDVGIGGSANIRESSGAHGWSTQSYIDWRNALGMSRVQVNYAADEQRHDSALTLDQAWKMPEGTRLSTSLTVEQLSGTGLEDHTALGLSVYGGGNLSARLSVDGNVHVARAIQGSNAPATAANVALTWQLSPNWSVLATYYESHTGSWNAITVTSPLTPPELITTPASDEQGVFLTVRYQRSGGAHFAPLGGSPGTGWGPVSGTLYLDANSNGVRDANEKGAANVTVLLNGRFSARTDSQGRYEFPAVATGHHVLTVVPDNLPLPWMIAGDGRQVIVVETRRRAVLDIGARRNDGI